MTNIQQFDEDLKIDLKKFPYRFKSRRKNPDWSVEKLIPLRSCLIHNNADEDSEAFFINKIPKNLTTLEHPICIDTGTGELIYADYETDDFKQSAHRKIKTVERFTDFYEPLYRSRKVSILFLTFTRADYAKKDMRRMVELVKRHFDALNRPVRGYLWALELAENSRALSGYHIHYHLVIVINRVSLKEIPEEWKFQDLWGQRTGIEFVKKSVRSYLSKYLYKSDGRILGRRAYAISRILK